MKKCFVIPSKARDLLFFLDPPSAHTKLQWLIGMHVEDAWVGPGCVARRDGACLESQAGNMCLRHRRSPPQLPDYTITRLVYLRSSIANTWPSTVLSDDSAYCTRALRPSRSAQGLRVPAGAKPKVVKAIFVKSLL